MLCVGSVDGSVREFGNRMTPGVGPALSADRSRIAFVDDDRLVIVDASGVEVAEVGDEEGLTAVQWQADGSGVIVQRETDSDGVSIERISLEQPASTVVIAYGLSGDVESGIAVSPDGSEVAYSARVDEVWELRVVDISTGDQRTVYSSHEYVYSPSWSPEGDKLAVVVGTSIQSIDVRDGTASIIGATGRDVTSPTWSPNGEDLLFVDSRGALLRVKVADWSTMEAIVDYTSGDFSERFPAFPQWT